MLREEAHDIADTTEAHRRSQAPCLGGVRGLLKGNAGAKALRFEKSGRQRPEFAPVSTRSAGC